MPKLGLIKNYLKIEHYDTFGVIAGGRSNICYLPNKKSELGSLCMAGFAEDVIIWDLNSKKIIQKIHGKETDNVTYITYFENQLSELTISIGYESGYVSVYSMWPFEKLLSIKSHRHPITRIIYVGGDGDTIVCGSQDTDISVVDIKEEVGYRLKGHTSPITQLSYLADRDILISSSQDGCIKFWFLSQKHCFKTIFNNSDVWDFAYVRVSGLLLTAGSDHKIKMWKLTFVDSSTEDDDNVDLDQRVTDRLSNSLQATEVGCVDRHSPRRVLQMVLDIDQTYLAVNTGEKKVELFQLMSEENIAKRLKKRSKKAKSQNQNPEEVTVTADDRLRRLSEMFMPNNIKSLSMIFNSSSHSLQILASQKNNCVAVLTMQLESEQLKVKGQVAQPGHRSAVVFCQFTSDGRGMMTASLTEAKLWNKETLDCILTIEWPRRKTKRTGDDEDEREQVETEMAIAPGMKLETSAAVLLPGDRHAVFGFKAGVVIVYSLVNGDMVQWMCPHQEQVTSLVISADKTRLLSSSTDRTLKVWKMDYGVMNSGAKGKVQLTETEVCQQYQYGVSAVKVTPDNKTVIVAFLNNKVQSYPLTNLSQRVLDFYKHSQPVTCIDVKDDSREMVTGSGDKAVVRWSLQFADCGVFKGHKEAVTDLRYVPGRSMALSCDSSGLIIQIELKNMSEILRLRGHGAQVTSLAVFSEGGQVPMDDDDEEEALGDLEVLSASTDFSLRLWRETDAILSREVEAEEERDRIHEQEELVREELIVVGAPQASLETGLLTRKTLNTEKAADELLEALELRWSWNPAAPLDPKMKARDCTDPDRYVLFVLGMVRGGDLEAVLAQLPMPYVEDLFVVAAEALDRGVDVFLLTRALVFLQRVHFKAVRASVRLAPLLPRIARSSRIAFANHERALGFVVEALEHLGGSLEPEEVAFEDKKSRLKPKRRTKNKPVNEDNE